MAKHGRHKKKKRNAGKIVGIVIAVILAIALIAAGGVFAYAKILGKKMAVDNNITNLLDKKQSNAFYTLVIGSDNWESYGARSDAMALVRTDIDTGTITIVSIPRDTPYMVGSTPIKMNQVYAEEGPTGCIKAVSQLTGVPISHYVEVEFDQLESVVDQLGGIWVDVPQAIDYTVYTKDKPTVHLDAGYQRINGEQAVALSRMRTAYGDEMSQDALRQANIRAMMTSLLKAVLTAPPAQIPGTIQAVAGMVKTDISISDMISWATTLAGGGKNVKVYTCTGPEEGEISTNPDAHGAWLAYEAPEEWATLMKAVDAGQDPTHVLDYSANVKQGLQGSTTIDTSVADDAADDEDDEDDEA